MLPDDAYNAGTAQFDGVVHVRLWHFGRWEDVYTDDYLPVTDSCRLWGAHSATNPEEIWVSLLEKAFTKLVAFLFYTTDLGILVPQSCLVVILRLPAGAFQETARLNK